MKEKITTFTPNPVNERWASNHKYRWAIIKKSETDKSKYNIIKLVDTVAQDVEGFEIAKAMCKPDESVMFYDTIAI